MTLGTQWAWGSRRQDQDADEVHAHAGPLRRRRRQPAAERRPDARRPRSSRARSNVLKEIGAWLANDGESIYGTRGGPFKPGETGVSTRKGRTIYLHAFEWTGER